MVRETLVLVDFGATRRTAQSSAADLVIDAPTDILGPGLATVRPPGVLVWLCIDLPEAIDKTTRTKELVEPGTLFRQKAGVLLVGTSVAQVDGRMSDIPVTAQQVVAAILSEPVEVEAELIQEAELRLLAFGTRRA